VCESCGHSNGVLHEFQNIALKTVELKSMPWMAVSVGGNKNKINFGWHSRMTSAHSTEVNIAQNPDRGFCGHYLKFNSVCIKVNDQMRW
jgi:aconitase A